MKDCIKNCLIIAPQVSAKVGQEKWHHLIGECSHFWKILFFKVSFGVKNIMIWKTLIFSVLWILLLWQDKGYCTDTCTDYCAQEDRADGLSGSVSADNGEVGILGGSFGQGTVPKGDDKVSFGRSIETIGCYSILFVVPHITCMSNLVLTFF